ncbi:MAG: hypothetical protein HC905_05555 [Bacteroidales bacterium]|nr:hypothetical protein [Bacteroidales bacterium]
MVHAQDTVRYGIKVIARAKTDSVLLRWAPLNYESWQHGMKTGYMVERYTMLRDGKMPDNKQKVILTPQPVKIYDRQQWEKLF